MSKRERVGGREMRVIFLEDVLTCVCTVSVAHDSDRLRNTDKLCPRVAKSNTSIKHSIIMV